MLTLILQTQDGQKVELNFQPEDTFADLKSQYPDNDGLPDSLGLLITNGANVPESTKIFDYVTSSAHEWFSTLHSVDIKDDAAQSAEVETGTKECCTQSCLNSEISTCDKSLFPSATGDDSTIGNCCGARKNDRNVYHITLRKFTRELASLCLIDAGRPELYDQILEVGPENCQKQFLCSSNFNQEASSLHPLCTAEQSSVSLLKPKNERMSIDAKEETTIFNEEDENYELREVLLDSKDSVLELLDTVEDFKHPGILCRLCGEPTSNPIHIYAREKENEEFNLADKINLCLPVTVTVEDPLPKQICEECQAKLDTCHELALSSLRTDDKLRLLLRESKLCVNCTTEQQCPLCLEGEMRTVKKSGIYRRDDWKNEFCCSANGREAGVSTALEKIVTTEDCNDLSSSRIHFPALDDSVSESTAIISAKIENCDENLPPPPDGEFPCSNCSAIINVASIRSHECPSENRDSSYSEMCNKNFSSIELINDHKCCQISRDPRESEENIHEDSPRKVPTSRKKQSVRYNCFFCQKEFAQKKTLKSHMSAVHSEEMGEPPSSKCYKCRSCNEAFARVADAEVHMTLRHLGPFSAFEFPAGEEFALEELTISRLYVCEYCERCFTLPSSLHDHREVEHDGSLKYTCSSCDSAFDSHRQLAYHKSAVSHRRPRYPGVRLFYVCKYCDKMFLHYSSLSCHALRHQEAAPYLCRPCNANFESYREIAVHRALAHPYQSASHERAKRSYKCQYCQKQFNYEVVLVKHMRIHTGERPYKCLICGKGFAQSSGLNTHVKIHSDVRPYACPKCPRTFKIKGDRDNHVKKHSGNRPYKCEFCSKAFMTQQVFSQHRRIHTNDRPYKCDICGEAFRRSHVLTVHRRIHTGEKPHFCDLCPKTYRQRSDLVKHRKVQHRINVAPAADLICSDSSYDSSAKSNRSAGNSSLLLHL